MKPIRFGTEGWRAVLADDYTFDRVRVVARAAGRWFRRQGAQAPVAVGHDTRFMGARFAAAVADELAACGLEARVCSGPLPTPAVGFYVAEHKLAGSVVLTASHNPGHYNGVKVKGATASSIPEQEANWIEQEANRALEEPLEPAPPAEHARFDVKQTYLDRLVSMVDRDLIARAKLTVVADMMHGAAGGYFDEALRRAGCAEVRAVRAEPDPLFEGRNPEPIGPNLEVSSAMTADPAVAVGLATDGDGDRLGMMVAGEYVDIQRTIVLVLYHLLQHRGWRGRVVRAINVTSMVDRLCQAFGCTVTETSVGFKNIAPEMVADPNVILGVEESGGFGIKGHIPDRDGSLAALMVCEAIAQEGRPVPEILDRVYGLVGGRLHFGRVDITLDHDNSARLREAMPTLAANSLAGEPVADINRLDGAKLVLRDGSWLLVRISGTEPLARVYAEGRSQQQVEGLLQSGRELVMRAAGE